MKYYFITYQATNRQGSVSIWNEVIKQNPMKFIKHTQEVEERHGNNYYDIVIINTCEISKKDFKEYDGLF